MVASIRSLIPRNRKILALLALVVVMVAIAIHRQTTKSSEVEQGPQPVRVAQALVHDIPRYFLGLGTVVPLHTTVIQSRVDGYLVAVHFKEGQEVHKGDLLAEIDPRPFLVQLEQAKGALTRDQALLKNARSELERYRKLLRQEAVPAQQVQTQEATVGQYEGAVQQDMAAIADAQLQLDYSKVTAPFTGKVGLRQVDVGATVRSADPAGIVRITRTRPTYVVFTLVESSIPAVQKAMKQAELLAPPPTAVPASPVDNETELASIPNYGLVVEVWSQDNKSLLATGTLLSLDNQIDPATGTVKAKAIIPNEDDSLFPNQFVNIRLLVDVIQGKPSVPTAAVQRSSSGYFVYRVNDGKVSSVPVVPGYANDTRTVIEQGLAPGDIVVTDGVDRLRNDTPVKYEL